MITAIANLIANEEKAYDVPSICLKYGLDPGEESEAFSSKRTYVSKRLSSKSQDFIFSLTEQLIRDYESVDFAKIAKKFVNNNMFRISILTRRNIIDEVIIKGNVEGKVSIIEFLNRIWQLDKMPSTDYRFINAAGDIQQHMINNDDWDYNYLFNSYLNVLYVSDKQFLDFVEQLVHPLVRDKKEQYEYVNLLNKHLNIDGFELKILNYISGIPVYRAVELVKGVKGAIKNLIFSADGPKPEIIISDSLNNDLLTIKNEEYCLIYDESIPQTGLLWKDLVTWWSKNKSSYNNNFERELYKRLYKSLDSKPEKLFFDTYFREFRNKFSEKLPALIPQVYLHYDPYTIKMLGQRRIPRQRMDFLFLFSNRDRVVIEIDGKQHYSIGENSSPRLYSEMVYADRELKLRGYDVYRFGGYELCQNNARKLIIDFVSKLFELHNIKV